MRALSIDIETYSCVDLAKSGVYRYAEDCEILLFGYSVDNGEVQVVDLSGGEKLSDEIRQHLLILLLQSGLTMLSSSVSACQSGLGYQ